MKKSYQSVTDAGVYTVRERYIQLLKHCVSYWHWLTAEEKIKRIDGRDWPKDLQGETMIGIKRLDNIYACLKTIIDDDIEGDLIETGVWRGGAVIFMKGILEAYNITDKKVWLADSFEGVPPPNVDEYPADKDDKLYTYDQLRVSKEDVAANFAKYDLLDDNVLFLKGWFKDTLHTAPIDKLSLLRLDGDLYESTYQALEALYPKLSPGGFCIIDDYGTFEYCAQAVTDYRVKMNITEDIFDIDSWGVYWRKSALPAVSK